MNTPISVSQLNTYIKSIVDNDHHLSDVFLHGETSNYKIYPSGHHYFTLKDSESVIKCVMFKSEAFKLKFKPTDGQKVIASGRISVFVRDGQYQLYCTNLQSDGQGDLIAQFEELKEKLSSEGLFDSRHKKLLPKYPKKVVLITSPAGAAVRDMIRIFNRRWPLCELIVAPTRVQGEQAPDEIVSVMRYVNKHNLGDVIITGRGGGSIEDLWAFNDERVARAIFASHIPVVSAVGHEPDVTISDFVADVRASTPSHAAEIVAPDISEVLSKLSSQNFNFHTSIDRIINAKYERLKRYEKFLSHPETVFQNKSQQLDILQLKLSTGLQRNFSKHKQGFGILAGKLDALSPLKVLSRGYSFATKEDGTFVKTHKDVSVGDKITICPQKGKIICTVETIRSR